MLLILICLAPVAAAAGESVRVAPDLYWVNQNSAGDPAVADRLLVQAKQAAEAGQVSAAVRLATEVLHHDPDEPTCRRVLGYELVEQDQDGVRWLTPFQARQVRRGFVWDGRFGWVKAEDLPRYEAGKRKDGRRWVSAEEDAARHATINDGWQVRTDHFQVTTNHSLETAATLAAELEQLLQVWRQLFAGYYLGDAEVRARFAGTRRARAPARPFNVIYHRDKAGYVAALRHKQPRIAETLGIYFDDLREAHFFADPDADRDLQRSTLYHEAVHQLFHETKRSKPGVGAEHNFWAVEGVATYFESLTPSADGGYTIGSAAAGRLSAARDRVREGYLVPLDAMASLGMSELQRRDDLPSLYSQMAGAATFLMHADDGRRRGAFVRYLRSLYAGRAKADALWRELDESPAEVQAAYRRWLLSNPGQ